MRLLGVPPTDADLIKAKAMLVSLGVLFSIIDYCKVQMRNPKCTYNQSVVLFQLL